MAQKNKHELDACTKLTHNLKKGIGVIIMLKCTVFLRLWGKRHVFFISMYGSIAYDWFFLISSLHVIFATCYIVFRLKQSCSTNKSHFRLKCVFSFNLELSFGDPLVRLLRRTPYKSNLCVKLSIFQDIFCFCK